MMLSLTKTEAIMPVVKRQQSLARTYLVLLTLVGPHLSTITGCFALGSAYLQPIAVSSDSNAVVDGDQTLTFLDQTAVTVVNSQQEQLVRELDWIKSEDQKHYQKIVNPSLDYEKLDNEIDYYRDFLDNSLKKLQELDLTAVDGNWELFLMRDSLVAILQTEKSLFYAFINEYNWSFNDESDVAKIISDDRKSIAANDKDYTAARKQLLARWGTETKTSGKPTAIDKARFSQF